MAEKVIPTGNEMISLPEIRESDAAILSVNFLHMGFKGLIESRGGGSDGKEFMKPFLRIDDIDVHPTDIKWDRLNCWIPTFKALYGDDISMEGIILAPVGERGFALKLTITGSDKKSVKLTAGLCGLWKDSFHTINESKVIEARKYAYESNWGSPFVMDLRDSFTIFSLAPLTGEKMDCEFARCVNNEIQYEISKNFVLEKGEARELVFYWGMGVEEVGAVTSAKELLRKGFTKILEDTVEWLQSRQRSCENAELDKLFNTNLFFNFFYASGITMDTEEFVLVTSRSPRYYVSAAYWDRDSLLWSFPSILLADAEYAGNMLEYVFTRQIRNIGIHSRYIDGTLLEPGFELDELCAPVIALYNYVNNTKDHTILKEQYIIKGLKKILSILETKKNKGTDLYETFLQPTDDTIVYPYITYDNVLVWKTYIYMESLLKENESREYCESLLQKAQKVSDAIWDNCVIKENGKNIFAWSTDLNGHWNIYDEPPGSLQLLPFYGFCPEDNEVYKNTVDFIRRPGYKFSFAGAPIEEIGCEHAPHPWILSIANSLICGRKEEFLKMLPLLKMDNGIACESVNETTGECETGEAFATCAGFLAYSIYHAFLKE